MAQQTIEGRVFHIGETEQVTEKFKKRTIVLQLEDGQFPNYPVLEFHQERCNLLGTVEIGDQVKIHYQLSGSGKEYNGRYFGCAKAWQIEVLETTTASAQQPPISRLLWPAPTPPAQKQNVPQFEATGEDDLPF